VEWDGDNPIVFLNGKVNCGIGCQQISQHNSCCHYPPILEVVNGIEKNRLVSPHGATHLKRRPRRRTPGTECIFFRIPGKRNAADRAERWRKKGNPLKAFRAETAGLLGNQQLGTGKTAGRKEKINNAPKK